MSGYLNLSSSSIPLRRFTLSSDLIPQIFQREALLNGEIICGWSLFTFKCSQFWQLFNVVEKSFCCVFCFNSSKNMILDLADTRADSGTYLYGYCVCVNGVRDAPIISALRLRMTRSVNDDKRRGQKRLNEMII